MSRRHFPPFLTTQLPHLSTSFNARYFRLPPPNSSNPFHPNARTISSITSPYSTNPCFSLLSVCKDLFFLREIHALLVVHGLAGQLFCQTKLVSLYGSFGELRSARLVFDGIRNPDLYSYKVMMRWYFLNDSYPETLALYRCMRKCLTENDDVVFSIVLKACSELRDIQQGRKLHCHVFKLGSPDTFVSTGLVDMYAKCREVGCSRRVFEEIEGHNVVSWTSLIAAYVQNDCVQEALVLFNRMREGSVEGNEFTIRNLVQGCGELGTLHQGKWLHGYMIKTGIHLNPFLATAVLDMYVKCGSVHAARSVLDDISTVDVVSWTAMIVGFTQTGLCDEALRLFVDKRWIEVSPNHVTVSSVLSACAVVQNQNMGKLIHSCSIKLGFENEALVQHALVHMYAKCHFLRDAGNVFDSILDKDVVSWNSIISGYVQGGECFSALHLFHQMRSEFLIPDPITCVSVISACASIGATQFGCSFHSYALKEGILSTNAYVGTAFLNFYAKCGDIISARKVFEEMKDRNAVTWSALISGYGKYGEANESLALFTNMLRENMEPNEAIFTTILSACSHAGKVGEGGKCFTSMCQDYKLTPSMKHYACMVDILSRAGRLDEALEFIDKMPIRPDVTVFGAFLHGCGLHLRFDLGDLVAMRVLKLYPDEACYYVLISKFYASNGRWNQANDVWNLMRERGISKSPAWSSVDMDVNEAICPLEVASFG